MLADGHSLSTLGVHAALRCKRASDITLVSLCAASDTNHGAFVFLRLSAMFKCNRAVTVCDQVLEAIRPYSIASSG